MLYPLDGYSPTDKCIACMSEATELLATKLFFLHQGSELYSNERHAFKDRWCEVVLYKFACYWVTGDFPLYSMESRESCPCRPILVHWAL